jgi:hypothetical protein
MKETEAEERQKYKETMSFAVEICSWLSIFKGSGR